jgi:hypothetical protein
MSTVRAYEEIIDFIAAGTSPRNLIAFRPSNEAKQRVSELISKEKNSSLSSEEKSELDYYMQLEHIMRLVKARAHQHITHE